MLRTACRRVATQKCTRMSPSLRSLSSRSSRSPVASLFTPMTRVNTSLPNMGSNSWISVRTYADVVKVPPMAESITEGTLREYTKEIGDFVKADEEVAVIETDKIDVSVNAPFSGTISKFLASPDDTVEVGQDLLEIEPGEAPAGGAEKPAAPKEEKKEAEAPRPNEEEDSPPSEATAEADAKETPKSTPPPAPKAEKPKPKPEAKKPEPASSSSKPSSGSFSRSENFVKMNRMRLRIAERLKESQNTAASLTTFNEVDMSAVLQMRKLYKDEIIKKTGVKFGFMGLFSKASSLAMKDIPSVNAAIQGPNIVYRDYVDISVAVATPKGLVTPVIRNAESLSVVELEAELVRLSHKARDGELTLEDMAGGTYTISNGGVFGSLMGTPIINTPQCAVLGLHGVKERPVAVDGKIEIRPMMYLALTYDHRIVDGREAVTFLRTVKELIEDPRKMLLW